MNITQFITDNDGNRISAVVPIKQFNHLLELAEELEDVKAYDKAMKRKQEFVPLDAALKEVATIRKNKK